MNYEKTVNKAVEIYKENWVILAVSTLVVFALGMLTLGLLFGPLMAGLAAMFVKAKSGKKPAFNDLFQFNGKFIGMAVMGLLIGTLVFLGCLALVLPGLILATLWMYSIFAMAFENKGITESMKASWNFVMKAGLWQQLVIMLAIGILNSIGGAIIVGPLITIPLGMGFLALIYTENK
ncbi:MAG TPA: hypothetical protein P5511_01210 [Candidatus Goldiibacteriota bacterium]|nr:hypothetical protein [Candidatus Goldiibacteriota bacterium]